MEERTHHFGNFVAAVEPNAAKTCPAAVVDVVESGFAEMRKTVETKVLPDPLLSNHCCCKLRGESKVKQANVCLEVFINSPLL